MIFQYICPPASLYLAFSIIQILIDMFRGEMNTAFLKFLVMIIFTIALNMLCASGLGIISWFIVFIPFILMTYITTILVFVFGIPKTSDLRPERKPRNEHNRDWWKHHQNIGGCTGTRFGCCDDGKTAKKNYYGSNCPSSPHPHHHHHHKDIIGGCAGTQYGCCPDKKTAKNDKKGTNCCTGTKYGCCNDGISTQPCPSGTSLVLDPEQSLTPEQLVGGCAKKKYGCCSDGSTAVAKACGVFNPVI
jgi:hypothetical protein